MDDQITLLDLELVDPPADAARDLIDPDSVRELAESIRSQGLLQPILVRPMNGRYEVIAGHRRFLAHRLIGEVKIKSIVREMTDEEVFVVRAVENDQREDLNPIEKGKVYKKLQDKFGWSIGAIGIKMGRSKSTIHKYLRMLEVPDEFKAWVSNGKISLGVALCLLEIDDSQFRKYYFAAAAGNGVTVEVAQSWVNEYLKTKAGNVREGEGGVGEGGQIQESLPVYQPCVCCLGPVEISKLRMIYVCRECESQVRGALKPK